MAKPKPSGEKIQTPQPLKAPTIKTKHSYRVEKLSQYEFQAFRATRQDDGTYIEEPFGKCTLFNLVIQKISQEMGKEAAEVFNAKRTEETERTDAIAKAAKD